MTTFVFSRRAIQTKLDLLEQILSVEQHSNLIKRLNRPGRERLGAMWEAVFLAALSEVVPIAHEQALADGRQPDFRFAFEHGGRQLTVVGDIGGVSDAGLDMQNPVRDLGDQVTRLARKYQLDPNHFRYDINGEQVGAFPKTRMKLLLPSGSEFQTLVNAVLEPFIQELAQAPPPTADFSHKAPGVDVRIRYDQSQWGAGGGYPSYDVATSLTENPIFRALRAKADQLRAAETDAIRLVILCDADCAAMRHAPLGMGSSFSSRQIATDFLRQTSAVDLVLLVTVEKRNPYSTGLRDFQMRYDLTAASPMQSRSQRINNEVIADLQALLEKAIRTLPKPMIDACNAAIRCQEKGYGMGKHGGSEMNDERIKISRRAVQELLAGAITQERFAEMHRWSEDSNSENPFLWPLLHGQLISSMTVIPCPEDDDDWIEFRFDPADPAISPFRRTNPGTS